jgi:DNA (cytosine-5)-methyltransferase 1
MNHLSLFSGIGGIDLAAHWAGMQTVAFVEQNKFCQKVLAKHWPNVPIFDDVKKLTKDDISEPIDIISGGFPCQPFSIAGNQLGTKDDRHLWPEYLRIIKEFKPAWVVGENVAGIINMALDNVLADLEAIGYSARAFDIPAASVGASHERRRVFIVAYSDNIGCERRKQKTLLRSEGLSFQPMRVVKVKPGGSYLSKPVLSGGDDGVSNRSHRLKALGNAVVPQQVFPIMQAIMKIEAMQ